MKQSGCRLQLWPWGGERLERDEDPDRNRVYSARGNGVEGGSVCARWKPQGVRVGARSPDSF